MKARGDSNADRRVRFHELHPNARQAPEGWAVVFRGRWWYAVDLDSAGPWRSADVMRWDPKDNVWKEDACRT